MLDLLIWLFVVGPINYLKDLKDYTLDGLLSGMSKERWELEQDIKVQYKLLTYFEECVTNDPSRAEEYEKSCDKICEELRQLKAKREGSKKIKILP